MYRAVLFSSNPRSSRMAAPHRRRDPMKRSPPSATEDRGFFGACRTLYSASLCIEQRVFLPRSGNELHAPRTTYPQLFNSPTPTESLIFFWARELVKIHPSIHRARIKRVLKIACIFPRFKSCPQAKPNTSNSASIRPNRYILCVEGLIGFYQPGTK